MTDKNQTFLFGLLTAVLCYPFIITCYGLSYILSFTFFKEKAVTGRDIGGLDYTFQELLVGNPLMRAIMRFPPELVIGIYVIVCLGYITFANNLAKTNLISPTQKKLAWLIASLPSLVLGAMYFYFMYVSPLD